ncbi:MAG: hypothetical protein HY606_14905 [Planctomycetes bacterium]|nr:hypothetical protein [Planctomycetota bacterium]
MKKIALSLKCEREMDCPRDVIIWNYYDHEHLTGTHYKYYNKARVLAEKNDWALVYRSKKMPFLPFFSSGIGFQYMVNENVMRTYHKDSVGFLLQMEAHFKELPNDRCLVTVYYKIETHPIFKIFEPLFKRLFRSWFDATWDEDAPMRLRRWKTYKLGFKDFYGIDYINKKLTKPEKTEYEQYKFDPPIKSLPKIKSPEGEVRPFSKSAEIGYND